MSSKTQFKRLPTNVIPINYAIKLQPNFDDFSFLGSLKIDVEVF